MMAAGRTALLAVLVAVGLTTGAGRAAARPLVIALEQGDVAVRAEAGLDRVARRLLAASEATLARIAEDLPDLAMPRTVEIRVVGEAADMQQVSPADRRVPAWAAGVAFPDLGVVVVATRMRGRPLDVDEVTKHELAHLALGAALGARAPRWLHEGFAYQHSAEWSWDRTETLAGMAWSGGIIPLDELDQRFPAEELPANRAYAQSYDFVGFLARRGRWEDTEDDGDRWPFREFLGEIARGAELDAAAQTAYGRPLRDLFNEWRADLGRRFLWIPAGLFGLLIWVVASVLLVLGFLRRRRQNEARLAEWDRQDAAADARREAWLPAIGDPDAGAGAGAGAGADGPTPPRQPN